MTKVIEAFGEDFSHETVIGALVERRARELGVNISLRWRRARGGYGRVVGEFHEYLRDLARSPGAPDVIIVATDANCRGRRERIAQLDAKMPPALQRVPAKLVHAVPDPHIERWLLLDGAAFQSALGRGCPSPDHKCERGRYKDQLHRAVLAAGVTPGLGGIEYAGDIVQAMDWQRARAQDQSLAAFLDDLDAALR